MGLIVATKAFFKLLFNRELSQSFESWSQTGQPPALAAPVPSTTRPKSKPSVDSIKVDSIKTPSPAPSRSDALTLLATLQREARLIDIVKEPLENYSDAQVGAAARDVLKSSGAVLDRLFGLQPLSELSDGAPATTPAKFDPAEYRLVGKVAGSPPFLGTLTHHGWQATRCDVPQWQGQADKAMIIAPIELEVG